MSGPGVELTAVTALPRVAAVPRSHLSLELGHLYMEDLLGGAPVLRRHFAEVKPWADFVLSRAPAPMRVSTCFLVDDYFSELSSPAELVPLLTEAAAAEGLTIDYLARESGCAVVGDRSPAELALARIVPDPPPGTDGLRPPPHVSGWLTNAEGDVRPKGFDEAMSSRPPWSPPRQNSVRGHSVCMDVQLWDQKDGRRRWSCAFLSAVWQLMRLGLLRDDGKAVGEPAAWPHALPDRWTDLPPVLRITERPPPFFAFRTVTVLPPRFAEIEAAVRMIVGQIAVDPAVGAQVARQAAAEKVDLPADLARRISHVFSEGL